ncbi:MAG: hypothetical protein ACI4A3_08085 [Lachnospiraceae bacterium]
MNQERLEDVINILTKISDYLYQENTKPAYLHLIHILPEFEQVIAEIEDDAQREELAGKLTEAIGAMEAEDHTLLADLLQYDIIDQLKQYVQK